MGESNTIVNAYTMCIGTYNSIALTLRYVDNEIKQLINPLPVNKILGLPKLNALADDSYFVAQCYF